MIIKSPAFNDASKIPQQYTSEGPNISPPLHFDNVPENAKSLLLLVEDSETTGKPRVHWHVYNIPPTCQGFGEGRIVEGAQQGLSNDNTFGYEGPGSSENEQFYLFKLYALDTVLAIKPEDSIRKNILTAIEGHVIEEATLTGKYQRK